MSKNELLKRLIGESVEISADSTGFIRVKKADERGESTLTGVGDDVFEISMCSNGIKRKWYYSIAHVRMIEEIEI